MSVITITSKSQFDDLLKSHPFVVLQASASWCGPCKAISPLFVKHAESLAIENSYAFAKFDTDDVPDLAFELGVRSLPTFLFFENGDKTDGTITGANPPVLKKAVEDMAGKAKTSGGALSTNEDF
ncbi:hypothetical protein E4U55_007499 [Claviceps digitariae]|nr:hypothetical protein E4U55_007499 [Claviceps digitariae]